MPAPRIWLPAIRVRQWPKNVLVFGAPAAAGALSHPGALGRTCVAAVAFCLLSSGAYLLNDLHDVAEDRGHPRKRKRPIAAGAISVHQALAASGLMLFSGLALCALLGPLTLAIAAASSALNFAYTACLRQIAIADIAAIAGAFILRAAAGAAATGVPISRWFFVVVSFCALFVAAGKRYADFIDPVASRSRRVLQEYNADFLRLVVGTCAAVALGSYCLWAFAGQPGAAPVWREVTIVPFTLALLRYGLLVTDGQGGAPEEILLRDRFLQATGVAWMLAFALGL